MPANRSSSTYRHPPAPSPHTSWGRRGRSAHRSFLCPRRRMYLTLATGLAARARLLYAFPTNPTHGQVPPALPAMDKFLLLYQPRTSPSCSTSQGPCVFPTPSCRQQLRYAPHARALVCAPRLKLSQCPRPASRTSAEAHNTHSVCPCIVLLPTRTLPSTASCPRAGARGAPTSDSRCRCLRGDPHAPSTRPLRDPTSRTLRPTGPPNPRMLDWPLFLAPRARAPRAPAHTRFAHTAPP